MVSFTPRPLYLRERAPDTHWIGGWVGPRAGLDMVSKRKIPSPRREPQTDHPIGQPAPSMKKTRVPRIVIDFNR
jgi:hypothetical protein